jgi:hypothetical protein
MLHLYLGYLIIKAYSLINTLSQEYIAGPAIVFSLVVFVIWSFVPMLGYLLAKLFGAKGHSSALTLFIVGMGVSLFENALFYFNALSPYQGSTGTFLVMIIFFISAYVSFSKPTDKLDEPIES